MKWLAYRLLSFQTLLVSSLVVLMPLTARDQFRDPDIWCHLKVGQLILETCVLPRNERFSYATNNHPWIPHESLSEALLYAAYQPRATGRCESGCGA